MTDRKSERAIWNEVLGFEERLRTGASRAGMLTRDPELASLFSSIGRRRRLRTDVTQVYARGGVVARAPQTSDATPTASRLQGTASSSTPGKSGAPGTVLAVNRIAGSVAMLQIAKPSGLRFRAGQHVKISLPGHGRNPYSIASAPSDPHLELCVERVPGGRVSTQLYALEPGMRVELDSQPKGDFVLQPKAAIHLMLATVTGIAPFRSILREAAAQNQWPYFVVLHGASHADELPYRQELEALAQRFPRNLRYLPSVSRPSDLRNRNFEGLTGRLTDLAPSLVRELQASRPGQTIQVYACGHPEMVSTVNTTLGSMGFNVTSEVFD